MTESAIPFLQLDGALRKQAAEKILLLGARARADLPTFFSLVFREERTQRALSCAPHQRVIFSFVLAHPRCVLRLPAGASKTFSMAALTTWLLGQDVTVRGAVVSATQGQASKPLRMVADYIETSASLKLAFPGLMRSARVQDPWTQTALTVARPPGIRDASLVAVGLDGALPGARLSWVIVDDVLSLENTSTPAGREKVAEFFDSTVLSRLDSDDHARIVVCNTPWHPDDLTFRLEGAGWPTLTMDVAGGIQLSNCPDFDVPDIRPSKRPGEWYRLAAHDPDVVEVVPLWPAKWDVAGIEDLKAKYAAAPHRFNQLFMCQCRDDETARCKVDWIDKCKVPGLTTVAKYDGPNATVTGIDLAVGQTNRHDATAFFTFECLPSGKRRILDVEVGHFDGPSIVKKIIDKAKRYNSIVRVENNAAQDYIRQFALQQNASIPIKAHTTGRNKAHPEFGVESLFVELQNGAWEIPCDKFKRCPPGVEAWAQQCLYYEPSKHTGDALMACWFAREQARDLGFGRAGTGAPSAAGSMGMNILAR